MALVLRDGASEGQSLTASKGVGLLEGIAAFPDAGGHGSEERAAVYRICARRY